jgi:type IV pilus assembly protein PilM
MFKKTKTSFLGIDIGHKNLKMAIVSNRAGKPIMERFFIREIPPDAFSDGQIEDMEALTRILEEGVRYLRCQKMDAAISIHPSMTMSYTINILSGQSPVEQEQDIASAISPQLPFPIEELALDWVDLGPSSEQEGMNDFLVVAAKRDLVDSLEQLIEGAGLSCSVIDIDSYIYPRFFNIENKQIKPSDEVEQPSKYALVDVGFSTVSMNIYEDHKLIYTKDHGFSQTFFEELNHYIYGQPDNISESNHMPPIPYLDILKVIQSEDAKSDDHIPMIIARHREELSDQVVNLVGFFNMHHPEHQVNKIYITGGGALVPGICDSIQEQLDITCNELRALRNIDVLDNIRPLVNDHIQGLLTKAVGLGLRCVFQGETV